MDCLLYYCGSYNRLSIGLRLVPVRNSIAEKLRWEDVEDVKSACALFQSARTALEGTRTLPRSVGTPAEGASTP